MKKKKKICHLSRGREGRKEEKKSRGGKSRKKYKLEGDKNGRINDRAQSPTVLIKWCLAHQSKCSLFDIIVSSLTYANLPLHNLSSQVEMSILP